MAFLVTPLNPPASVFFDAKFVVQLDRIFITGQCFFAAKIAVQLWLPSSVEQHSAFALFDFSNLLVKSNQHAIRVIEKLQLLMLIARKDILEISKDL